ncbi:hypothetical protein [Rhodoligotrophos defluvii]|uniref:hypothetical protein n=1 Tax=Rhodoligotrophos defluvii TaxID=2561934 RepID=UPI0010C96E7F|nr:hypothetical protein [Rhodoligotrophos defluvii]
MRAIVWGAAGLVGGYLVGAVVAYAAVQLLSGNTHDKALEALYSGFFFAGPAVSIIAGIAGVFLGLRKPKPGSPHE